MTDDVERDAWLSQALRHAPDAGSAAPAALRDAILREAAAKVKSASVVPPAAVPPPWLRFWNWLARPPVAAGFAGVMAATLVGLMWWDQPMDDAMPRAPARAPSSEVAPAVPPPPAPSISSSVPPVAAQPAPARAPEPAVVPAPARAPKAVAPPTEKSRVDAAELRAARPAAPIAPPRPAAPAPAPEAARMNDAAVAESVRSPVIAASPAPATAPPATATAPPMPGAPRAQSMAPGDSAAAGAAAPLRDNAAKGSAGASPAPTVSADFGGLSRQRREAPLAAEDAPTTLRAIADAVRAQPQRWRWQHNGGAHRVMSTALQTWLSQVAATPSVSEAERAAAPGASGPMTELRLMRDGRPQMAIRLDGSRIVWLRLEEPAAGGAVFVDPAAMQALRAALDDATR